MRLPILFAFRYVFSKKKTNAINIISGITMGAFAIGAASMIIVLSALNGFESTISHLFTSFDPELKIEAIKGKTFELSPSQFDRIRQIPGVSSISGTLEDNAVLRYGESQEIAVVKGVDLNYNQVTGIDCTLVEGRFSLGNETVAGAVFGYALAERLGISLGNPTGMVTIYAPSRGEFDELNPERNLVTDKVYPSGKFFVHEDIDSRYILVSLPFARRLFDCSTGLSAIEMSLNASADKEQVRKQLSTILGKDFLIKDQYQQKESIYKIFRSEKMATFAILSFILLIAAFNMAGALTMLIIEKEKDILILRNIGLRGSSLRQIFLGSGLIIALTGCLLGILAGGLICWLQIHYGLLSLENSVVDYYPVALRPNDFIIVFLISACIGLITAWIPVRKLT